MTINNSLNYNGKNPKKGSISRNGFSSFLKFFEFIWPKNDSSFEAKFGGPKYRDIKLILHFSHFLSRCNFKKEAYLTR